MKYAFLCAGFILMGCSNTAPVIAVKSCPANREWSKSEQREMLEEEKKLSSGSILILVFQDYARMRAENRGCR